MAALFEALAGVVGKARAAVGQLAAVREAAALRSAAAPYFAKVSTAGERVRFLTRQAPHTPTAAVRPNAALSAADRGLTVEQLEARIIAEADTAPIQDVCSKYLEQRDPYVRNLPWNPDEGANTSNEYDFPKTLTGVRITGLDYLRMAIQENGLSLTFLKKLYYYDTVKVGGVLVGTDSMGNKYYENKKEQYGQHRWVEYNPDNGPIDASMIAPEWHGWMHHVFDEPPSQADFQPVDAAILNNQGSSSPNATHNAGARAPQGQNYTHFRHRGFRVGSATLAPGDTEPKYWTQRGSWFNKDYAPNLAPTEYWDPNSAKVGPKEEARRAAAAEHGAFPAPPAPKQ